MATACLIYECLPLKVYQFHLDIFYTGDAGLPNFNRAALITMGTWYYASAKESKGAKQYFRCRLVNISSINKQ